MNYASETTILPYHQQRIPKDDKRWKLISATMRRYGNGADALIESLHTVQDTYGYLDTDALRIVAAALRLPYSRVYGVATFYSHFRLRPQGKHTCVVCTGTACHIRGAQALVDGVSDGFGVRVGGMSQDGNVSLLEARCVGACGLAPVATVDGKVLAKVSSDELVDEIRARVTDDAA